MTGVTLGLTLAGMFVAGVVFGRFLAPNRRPWWMEFALPEHEALADAKRVLSDRYALGEISAEEYHERVSALTRKPAKR